MDMAAINEQFKELTGGHFEVASVTDDDGERLVVRMTDAALKDWSDFDFDPDDDIRRQALLVLDGVGRFYQDLATEVMRDKRKAG